MSETSLEEIIKTEYKEALYRSRPLEDFRHWEKLYLDILEAFGKKPEDLGIYLKDFIPRNLKEPHPELLEYLISKLIKEVRSSELWKGIVKVEKGEIFTPYKTIYRYSIKLTPRLKVIENFPSFWVYQNHSEIEEFLGDNFYDTLESVISGKYIEYD